MFCFMWELHIKFEKHAACYQSLVMIRTSATCESKSGYQRLGKHFYPSALLRLVTVGNAFLFFEWTSWFHAFLAVFQRIKTKELMIFSKRLDSSRSMLVVRQSWHREWLNWIQKKNRNQVKLHLMKKLSIENNHYIYSKILEAKNSQLKKKQNIFGNNKDITCNIFLIIHLRFQRYISNKRGQKQLNQIRIITVLINEQYLDDIRVIIKILFHLIE